MRLTPLQGCSRLLGGVGLAAVLAAYAPTLAAQNFPVSGQVVDAATGQPVARATVDLTPITADDSGVPPVQVAPSPGQEQGRRYRGREFGQRGQAPTALADFTTGADGSFLFPAVAAGRYRLSAARRGYAASSLDEHGGFYAAVIVGSGTPATRIRFPLLPNATIEGTVLDSSGDPVETASLTLFRQVDDGTGAIRPVRNAFVQPGDSSYFFSDLAPGTYYLSASGRPWYEETQQPSTTAGTAPNPLDVVYPMTFYAGADSSAGAQPIVVAAGDDAHADMTLSAAPAIHLQIPAGAGAGSFSLPQLTQPAFSGSMPVRIWQTTYQSGGAGQAPERTITVAPGTYTLDLNGSSVTVDAANGATVPATAEQGARVSVSGKVAMADGSPLPVGASLTLMPMQNGADDSISQEDFAGAGGTFLGVRMGPPGGYRNYARLRERSIDATLQPDGTFHADAVSPGEYRLAVSASGRSALFVTGAAAGGAQVSGDASGAFVLHVGTQNTMLAATVARANCAVQGVVIDSHGAPEAGVMVLIAPAHGAAGPYRQDESNSDGSWLIHDIPAGSYRVIAIRDGWDLAWRNAAVLAPYLAAAVPALVPADGNLALRQPVPAQNR